MRLSTYAITGILTGMTLGVGIFVLFSPLMWPKPQTVTKKKASRLSEKIHATALVLGMSPAVVVSITIALVLVSFVASFSLVRATAFAVVIAVASVFVLPTIARLKQKASEKAARNLWPDVVDMIISALRSGSNIPDALISLSSHSSVIVRGPAQQFAHDYGLTGNFHLALDDVKSRWASAQSDRIIETLRLGRELGGSEMTSVLSALGSHLRAESALRQEMEARQGWVRIAARIGIAAPVVVLLLLSSQEQAADAYNSALGFLLIFTGMFVTVLAYNMMNAMGSLASEKRWLE